MDWRRLIAPGAGALAWVAILGGRLQTVADRLWIARDDAVITLSHARNAAEFGSIGVSPGGDRVEGFSSPLHFAVAYLVHVVSSPGYRSLTVVIMLAAVAGMGAAIVFALRGVSESSGRAGFGPDVVTLGLAVAVALLTAASWTSVGWIGSGMENPLVICAGLAVTAATTTRSRPRFGQIFLVASLGLFMISRVEFAALALPLVVVAAWINASHRVDRTRLAFFQTVGATLLLVACVHLGRRLYFGDWLPNTARVQGRASGLNEVVIIGLISAIILMLFAMAVLTSREPSSARYAILRLVLSIGSTVLAVLLIWMAASGRSAGSMLDLLLLPPLLVLLVLVLVLLQLRRFVRPGSPWLLNYAFAALVAVPLTQYVVTGPARLDGYRIAVIAVPFLGAWAAALFVTVASARPPVALASLMRHRFARIAPVGMGLVALTFAVVVIFRTDQARYLNYEITDAPTLVDVVHNVRDQHLGGDGLVILANPDLGKVSYDKSAVMVDLGLLGDPLLTSIVIERPDLVSLYLGEVARPDVVQTHSGWSCEYGDWLESADFKESYELSDERWLEGRAQAPGCLIDGKWAIWVRFDADAEHELTRELMQSAAPATIIRKALLDCSSQSGGAFRCQHVRRSLQRAADAMLTAGTFGSAVREMNESPSAVLDIPMLERKGNWGSVAFDAFVQLAP